MVGMPPEPVNTRHLYISPGLIEVVLISYQIRYKLFSLHGSAPCTASVTLYFWVKDGCICSRDICVLHESVGIKHVTATFNSEKLPQDIFNHHG